MVPLFITLSILVPLQVSLNKVTRLSSDLFSHTFNGPLLPKSFYIAELHFIFLVAVFIFSCLKHTCALEDVV